MATPERLTLAERMALAAQRAASSRPGAISPGLPMARAGYASAATAAHGAAWIVAGRVGQETVLMPGQMSFGVAATTMRTLLGSCVAITLWHPVKRIGGMCHFLLPTRARKLDDPMDGRYGTEAVETMVQMLRKLGVKPDEFHAHLYGGADTMPEGTQLKFNVGERNIELGWSLIDKYGFQLQGVDVGEDVPRTVVMAVATGEVECRRGAGKGPAPNAKASSQVAYF